MAVTAPSLENYSLTDLPDEVLLHILSYLHVSDLLQVGRTCHLLRFLAADPVLHEERLRWASANLELSLSKRKTKASISPPNAWIWLSKTNVLSRSISKSLIKIRLCHSLERRPSTKELVARAILPSYSAHVSPLLVQSQQSVYKNRLRDGLRRKLERRPSVNSLVSMNILPEECVKVSPALVDARRRVIKESLKDGLRAWVETRGIKAQQRRAVELDESERRTVKALVRRLTARKLAEELDTQANRTSMEKKRAQARWGRALENQRIKDETKAASQGACIHPTRAHVFGLKRFWESVIRTAST
ncbi:hypothetical protein OHC33_002329 [Knufia fluminis]|uniref:F-box domain-containing protein n=1 Tax=Knufia fluminis TaxID=191047 RepID=A0AAN8IBC0_9EURO|nr:hypothetical protein OHC33_002329 [Knufia fluminis]